MRAFLRSLISPPPAPRAELRRGVAGGLALLWPAVGAAAVAPVGETGGGAWLLSVASLVLVLVLCVAVERVLVHAVRGLLLAVRPMIGGQEAAGPLARYERSLFTPGSNDARLVLAALCVAGLGLWLGWNGHAALTFVGLLAFAIALGWDLWAWECVVVSRWQVAWRRGWRRSVRRLPLIQVAEVHVVERRAVLPGAWLTRHLARRLGTSYLAVELHNGKALKLPRTGLLTGGIAVEQVARYLQRHLRVVERERRLALRGQLRAMRRVQQRAAPEADEQALHRELSLLRVQSRRPAATPSRGRTLAPE